MACCWATPGSASCPRTWVTAGSISLSYPVSRISCTVSPVLAIRAAPSRPTASYFRGCPSFRWSFSAGRYSNPAPLDLTLRSAFPATCSSPASPTLVLLRPLLRPVGFATVRHRLLQRGRIRRIKLRVHCPRQSVRERQHRIRDVLVGLRPRPIRWRQPCQPARERQPRIHGVLVGFRRGCPVDWTGLVQSLSDPDSFGGYLPRSALGTLVGLIRAQDGRFAVTANCSRYAAASAAARSQSLAEARSAGRAPNGAAHPGCSGATVPASSLGRWGICLTRNWPAADEAVGHDHR